jgi:hypothetical protein
MGEQQAASGWFHVDKERRLVGGFYLATAGRERGAVNDGVRGIRQETWYVGHNGYFATG